MLPSFPTAGAEKILSPVFRVHSGGVAGSQPVSNAPGRRNKKTFRQMFNGRILLIEKSVFTKNRKIGLKIGEGSDQSGHFLLCPLATQTSLSSARGTHSTWPSAKPILYPASP